MSLSLSLPPLTESSDSNEHRIRTSSRIGPREASPRHVQCLPGVK